MEARGTPELNKLHTLGEAKAWEIPKVSLCLGFMEVDMPEEITALRWTFPMMPLHSSYPALVNNPSKPHRVTKVSHGAVVASV